MSQQELFQIVDEQDNVIAAKPRSELLPNDVYRVSGLWLTNSQGEVLLAKRALSKDHDPGKWGPAVAGTVEANESYEDNIKKESYEELGLGNVAFILGPKFFVKGRWTYFAQYFYAKIDKPANEFELQQAEVAEVRWFTMSELKQDMLENPGSYLVNFRKLVLQDTFSATKAA